MSQVKRVFLDSCLFIELAKPNSLYKGAVLDCVKAILSQISKGEVIGYVSSLVAMECECPKSMDILEHCLDGRKLTCVSVSLAAVKFGKEIAKKVAKKSGTNLSQKDACLLGSAKWLEVDAFITLDGLTPTGFAESKLLGLGSHIAEASGVKVLSPCEDPTIQLILAET